MPKLILGLGRDRIVVDNPRWGVRYSRVRHVQRRSTRVKAINVCTIYFAEEKKVGEKRASASVVASYMVQNERDLLKQVDLDITKLGEPVVFKTVQGYAMAVMLKYCTKHADEVCGKYAARMGLDKTTCVNMLKTIKVEKKVPPQLEDKIKEILGIKEEKK